MEKILFAIDSQNLDENAVHFAAYLTRLTQSNLIAIFLEDMVREGQVIIQGGVEEGAVISIRESIDNDRSTEIRDQNILLFIELIREE